MDFWNLCKIFSVGLLIINYNKINYYKLGNNAINFYKKIKKKILEIGEESSIQKLIFIKNGEELIVFDFIKNKIINNNLNKRILDFLNIDYDFIIFQDDKNFIRINNFKELMDLRINGYKIKKKLFISLKLIHSSFNEKIDINLKDTNFMIKDNILLDNKFIKWYCLKFLNINLDLSKDFYFIILDKNIKEYKLNKSTGIKITDVYFDIIEDTEFNL